VAHAALNWGFGRALGSRGCLVLLAGSILFAVQCAGTASATGFGAYQVHVEPADVFPGADRFGPVEGELLRIFRNESL